MNSDYGSQRIYWVLLIAGILILSVLSWLSHSALSSVPQKDKQQASSSDSTMVQESDSLSYIALVPAVAKERASRFEYYSSILGKATPLIFIILMIFANVIYVKQGRGFYLTLSVLFFIAFTMVDYLMLSQQYFTFKGRNDLWENGSTSSGLIGIVLIIMAIIATLFNHSILKNWRRRQPLHSSPDKNPQKPYDSSKLN